jgi:hypothetical protein
VAAGAGEEEVETAKAAVTLAEKRLDEAKTNHDYRRVVVASSGIVLKVYRHAADSVQAGTKGPKSVFGTGKDGLGRPSYFVFLQRWGDLFSIRDVIVANLMPLGSETAGPVRRTASGREERRGR